MDFLKTITILTDFLDREGVSYGLVGGLALQHYGLTRATFDLDLVLAVDAQPKLVPFLESIGYETLHLSQGFSNHLHPDPAMGRIDLIYVDEGTRDRLLGSALSHWTVGNRSLPVPRPEHLIAMKVHAMKNDPRRTFRELADIQFLMGLPGVEEQEVRAYFEKAGLQGRFDELKNAH